MKKHNKVRCNAYHIYGDNSGREYSIDDLKEYFKINSEDGTCIKDFMGEPKNMEFYGFRVGDQISVMRQDSGTFRIRKIAA